MRKAKEKWEKTVKEYNVVQAGKEGKLQEVEYVNIPRITELILQLKNKLPETSYTSLLRAENFVNNDNSLKEELLDYRDKDYPFDFGKSYLIKYHYFELFKLVIHQLNFIDLDSILSKNYLKSTNIVGTYCFYIGGLYGNSPKLPIDESTGICHLYFRRKYFFVEWKIDPKYIVSTTAISRMSQHTVYIVYGVIRNIGEKIIKDKKFIHIDIRPFIVGAPEYQKDRVPYIKYIKDGEYNDEDYEDEYPKIEET